MANCLCIPYVTGFAMWSNVLGCLPPTGIPRKIIWMSLLTFSETVGELMTEDSLCGAITWCCWCFCGEMRAGKLSVFVHWIRLRTILVRSRETTITSVPGSCFFPDIPFSSRRPYFFVYESFTALSLFPPRKEILLPTTGKYPIPESSPSYYSQPHGNSDICSVLHIVYIPFALHFAPLACITICSNKATVGLFFHLSLLVQWKCDFLLQVTDGKSATHLSF